MAINPIIIENEIYFKQYAYLTKAELNSLFIAACVAGQTEHVKYLLSSKDIPNHANINAENDMGFILAIKHGFIEYSGNLVRRMIHNSSYTNPDYYSLIKYLIVDKELKKSVHISSYLNSVSENSQKWLQQVNSLFYMMELKKELESKLKKIDINETINKI